MKTDNLYVVMLAQKFEDHFEESRGLGPLKMRKDCPQRFLAVFDDIDKAIEWAGDESKIQILKTL